LAPNVPVAIAAVITGTTSVGAAPSNSTSMTTEELIKAMEELKLQVSELK